MWLFGDELIEISHSETLQTLRNAMTCGSHDMILVFRKMRPVVVKIVKIKTTIREQRDHSQKLVSPRAHKANHVSQTFESSPKPLNIPCNEESSIITQSFTDRTITLHDVLRQSGHDFVYCRGCVLYNYKRINQTFVHVLRTDVTECLEYQSRSSSPDSFQMQIEIPSFDPRLSNEVSCQTSFDDQLQLQW